MLEVAFHVRKTFSTKVLRPHVGLGSLVRIHVLDALGHVTC